MRKSLAFCVLAACALAFIGRAFADETTPAPTQPSKPPVVFMTPHNADPAFEASLREAVEAQFSGMQASLIFRQFDADLPDLRSQARAARDLARALSARAVFWVEASNGQEILLYLTEPDAERILVRRLQTASTSPAASAEMVSIITRESTAALLAGHTIGMQPVNIEPTPAAPPPPAPAPPPPPKQKPAPPRTRAVERSPISVDLGYQGNTYAQQAGWQNGIYLGARWVSAKGFYAGASYVLYEPIDVQNEALALEVTRHPIGVAAGWRFTESAVALLTQIGYEADLVARKVVRQTQGVERTPDELRVASIMTPRVTLEYDVTLHLSIYADAGIDVAMNNFEFVTQVGAETRPLLSPYRVRASAGLGVSFRP